MKNHLLSSTILGSITVVTLNAIALIRYISTAIALTPVEVQRIAKQTTVQITGCDLGSGVIFQKSGNTYTVLTVAHAVRRSGCKIVAPDNIEYPVSQVKTFPDRVDLAVVNFTSNQNYQLAKLIDNSDRVEAGENIYVSGFPLSTAISTSVFTFVKGDVVSNSSTKQQGKGYSLIYSNNTLPGHSGGPVWNDRGELIAIHGQGDIDSKSQGTINDDVRVKTGYNLGITVNTFTKLAKIVGIGGYAPVVVAAKPRPVDDLIASALLKERKGDYRGMLIDINRAIALDSQNSRPYNVRGTARYRLSDKKGAIDDYNRALALNPNESKAYNNRGNVKAELGDKKGAIDDYNRALALNPNLAEAYSNRGNRKAELGNKKGAIDDYNRALALNPNLAEAYGNRGNVKAELGDKKGAIDDYNRALVINPNESKAYNNRGNVKFDLGDKQGAIDDYNRALASNSNYAEAYYNRGNAKTALGNNKGAIDDYNRALALNPNYAKAYGNRGKVKYDLGDKQGAIDDYNRFLVLKPNESKGYYARAIAKTALGDKKGAIDDYNRALELNPNYAEAHGNRGDVKYKLGDKKGAIADLRRSAALFQQQGQTANYQKVMFVIDKVMSQPIDRPDIGF